MSKTLIKIRVIVVNITSSFYKLFFLPKKMFWSEKQQAKQKVILNKKFYRGFF